MSLEMMGESSVLSFPVMLTSVEGSGNVRTVEPNEQILALVQWVNENAVFDGITSWDFPYQEEFIKIDDDLIFSAVSAHGSEDGWDYICIEEGLWYCWIYSDGRIEVDYD